jgi:flagellar biosynthesis anti-sigma factor FlgM
MKINNLNDTPPPPALAIPARAPEVAREPLAANPPSAEVKLSSLSAKVVEATADLKKADLSFDEKRVAEVRRRVQEGTQPIDPTRIADALLAQTAFAAKPEGR